MRGSAKIRKAQLDAHVPRRHTRGVFTSLVLSAALWFAQAPELLPPGHRPNPSGTHFLKNATVFVRPGERQENGSILIRDGRIAAVGNNLQAPDDARVWEMNGASVYAGFIDPYLTLKPSTNVLGFQSFAEEMHDHEPRASGMNFFGVAGQEKDPGKAGPGYHVGQVTPERMMAENYSHDAATLKSLR